MLGKSKCASFYSAGRQDRGGMESGKMDTSVKILEGGRILAAAQVFDDMTAMSLDRTPESEIATARYLMDNKEFYSEKVVRALMDSINILSPAFAWSLVQAKKHWFWWKILVIFSGLWCWDLPIMQL